MPHTKNVKEEQNPTELLKKFSQLFFKMGRFPGSNELAIILMGVTPAFVKTNDVISSFDLYKKFQLTNAHGLVAVQFLATLKNAMSGFFHNLSMQALSREDDRIEVRFNALLELNNSTKNLLMESKMVSSKQTFVDLTRQTFREVKDKNQLFEEDVVSNIVSGTKVDYPQDTDHMSFPNMAREIEMQSAANLEQETRLALAVNAGNEEILQDLIENCRKELMNTLADVEGEIAADVISDLGDIGIPDLKTDDKKLKRSYKEHVESTIKKIT